MIKVSKTKTIQTNIEEVDLNYPIFSWIQEDAYSLEGTYYKITENIMIIIKCYFSGYEILKYKRSADDAVDEIHIKNQITEKDWEEQLEQIRKFNKEIGL